MPFEAGVIDFGAGSYLALWPIHLQGMTAASGIDA